MDVPRAVVGPLGQKLLFYQGHVYTMKAKKNAVNVRWICHHYKLYKCKATINTDNQTHTTVFSTVPHCHPPNDEELEGFEKQMEIKKLARKLLDDNVKPGDLVDKSLTYKSLRSKRGEVSVESLKRLLRRDRERLRKQKFELLESLNPVTGILEVSHDFDVPRVSQNEPTAPSTSGVVPKPSANTTAPSNLQFQPVKSPVPVQTDVRASAKPYVPVEADIRSTPTPPVVKKSSTTPTPEPDPMPPLEDHGSISVKWNTYATNMSSVMPSLLEDEKFVDVTLACDGKYIKCHKVILGACSPYFEELLSVNPCQHPIILMKDFQFWEIQAIVDFIYRGVVNIPQNKLPKLLQVACVLQIKGLTGAKNDTGPKADDVKTSSLRKEGGSKLKKRSESSLESGLKKTEVPAKKSKLISKSSSRNSFESHSSDESRDQSDVTRLPDPALAVSLEPSTMFDSVCIKEEASNYDVDDSSECPFRDNTNLTKDDFSELGQFQLLTLPGSKTIKEEVSEEIFNPKDEDPLELEPGVS